MKYEFYLILLLRITPQSIENFEMELTQITWDDVMSSNEPQATYSLFHNKFMFVYDKCFPIKRCKVNSYTTRIPWLSESLKRSIAYKNELYKAQKITNNHQNKMK